jgi:nicotinamidase-related amidase
MQLSKTAIIFIGYQNDYFADDGILKGAIEESANTNRVLDNTLALINQVKEGPITMIQTPIHFTDTYEELQNPVGILKVIQDVGAFKKGQPGSQIIHQFTEHGDRIQVVDGKRGLNAFSNTELERTLIQFGIQNVVLAGAVTSICIDSTGRAAHERGYNVFILEDCTAGRSNFEQSFYCENIFPLYAKVLNSADFLTEAE